MSLLFGWHISALGEHSGQHWYICLLGSPMWILLGQFQVYKRQVGELWYGSLHAWANFVLVLSSGREITSKKYTHHCQLPGKIQHSRPRKTSVCLKSKHFALLLSTKWYQSDKSSLRNHTATYYYSNSPSVVDIASSRLITRDILERATGHFPTSLHIAYTYCESLASSCFWLSERSTRHFDSRL